MNINLSKDESFPKRTRACWPDRPESFVIRIEVVGFHWNERSEKTRVRMPAAKDIRHLQSMPGGRDQEGGGICMRKRVAHNETDEMGPSLKT